MYDRELVEEFYIRMEEVISSSEKNKAFELITLELGKCEDKYLADLMGMLNYLEYEPVLDWIEENAERTYHIVDAWGHLAASSGFSWERAKKWLEMGRPWSLIALDALLFCTTRGERLNQSPWMREINPRLSDNPKPDEIASRLREYLKIDSVPRTRGAVNRIVHDIFEVG